MGPAVTSLKSAAQDDISKEIAEIHAISPGIPQPQLDFPPYRSSLLRHPTKALQHADPERYEVLIALVDVPARAVRLPYLDQLMADRAAVGVEQPAVHGDPLADGLAGVLDGEVGLRRVDFGVPEDRREQSDAGAVELNEAFAAQSLACIRAWDIDPAIVNVHGGAVAIGHPLGASGTRILGTLARSLAASGQRWGVAAICIGVGQGLAVVLESAGR